MSTKAVLNPDTLYNSLQYNFSQIAVSEGSKIIHLSGQVSTDAAGNLVAEGNFALQLEQSLKNVQLAMEAAGATLQDVASLRIYIHGSQMEQMAAVSEQLGKFFPENPPAATWLGVVALANPNFLVEVEAFAVIT